jgi:hypothetical protein
VSAIGAVLLVAYLFAVARRVYWERQRDKAIEEAKRI